MVGGGENKPIASIVQKIAKECDEAGCNTWTITRIIKDISREDNASEKQLRKKTLELLTTLDPAAAQVYTSFQRLHVRTSKQTIEPFDRGNIIKSLLKETNVTRGVAEKIGHEVEYKIKDLEISRVSTALIREMVSVKLLEYGHENIRNQYARLGLPVSDLNKKIRHGPYTCREMLVDYNLLKVIPRKLGDLHLNSEIFIASLDSFSTKPIALCHEFEAKEDLTETIFANLGEMNKLSRFVSWPLNASHINIALLPFVKRRTVGKAIDLFMNGFESIFYYNTNIPRNLGIDLFQKEEGNESIDRELIGASANLFLKKAEEFGKTNTHIALSIDTKYKLKLLHKNNLGKSLLLNCKTKELSALNGIALKGNMCGLFGINLAKTTSDNEHDFFEQLESNIAAAKELAELKKNILAKREYLKKADIKIGVMQNAIGFYGLFAAATQITQSQKEKEIIQFAEKIVSRASKQIGDDMFLTELLNRTGIRRFENMNKTKKQLPESLLELGKESAIPKEMQMIVRADNKKELNEFIDRDIKLIAAH
tara:strand:+ start:76 stop:1692 length:1617 start_codon:yes stop_codon:yes gene_type:complete